MLPGWVWGVPRGTVSSLRDSAGCAPPYKPQSVDTLPPEVLQAICLFLAPREAIPFLYSSKNVLKRADQFPVWRTWAQRGYGWVPRSPCAATQRPCECSDPKNFLRRAELLRSRVGRRNEPSVVYYPFWATSPGTCMHARRVKARVLGNVPLMREDDVWWTDRTLRKCISTACRSPPLEHAEGLLRWVWFRKQTMFDPCVSPLPSALDVAATSGSSARCTLRAPCHECQAVVSSAYRFTGGVALLDEEVLASYGAVLPDHVTFHFQEDGHVVNVGTTEVLLQTCIPPSHRPLAVAELPRLPIDNAALPTCPKETMLRAEGGVSGAVSLVGGESEVDPQAIEAIQQRLQNLDDLASKAATPAAEILHLLTMVTSIVGGST
eukprot:Sspe_Gene.83878::Locus_55024_Transcript_1_1_Confidence_1.000_Length_1224::g.83878::m.83878